MKEGNRNFFIRTIIALLLVIIVTFTIYISNEFIYFNYLKSNATISKMSNWGFVLSSYSYREHDIPNVNKFFSYCNDSIIKEVYGNTLPEKLRADDFIILTDSVEFYNYIWLFKDGRQSEYVLYENMSFIDFMFKKSILIIKHPYPLK